MVRDAVLEIYTEEIPARFLESVRMQIVESATELLNLNHCVYKSITSYVTPRRLVLYITQLEDKQKDTISEILGPPVKIAFTADNNPTPAAVGFAKSVNVNISDLTRIKTEKGEYLAYRKQVSGNKSELVLPQIFVKLIMSLSFPKTMVWEETRVKFVRPIRNLCALYGNKLIKFSFAGVQSKNYTYGPIFALTQKIPIPAAEKYLATLRSAYVIVDQTVRRELIVKLAQQAVIHCKGQIVNTEKIVDELVYLTEFPTAVFGKFENKYLSLPPEVVANCLLSKQKFFPVSQRDKTATLKLLPCFVGIRNGITRNHDIVREGYERVLKSRLADAEFFYQQDNKKTLSERVDLLKQITFQEQLGSLYDKVQRTLKIVDYLYDKLIHTNQIAEVNKSDLVHIVSLSKTDLTTEMVKEYPELQGVMGRIYARQQAESDKVALSLEQYYFPLTSDSDLPELNEAKIVSIADKMDTLVSDLTIGLIPTGKSDPYGLRRYAMGILRVLRDTGWNMSLNGLIECAWQLLPEAVRKKFEFKQSLSVITEFLLARLETLLTQMGYEYDEIRAVLAAGIENVSFIFTRIKVIKEFRNTAEGLLFIQMVKRINNILASVKYGSDNFEVNPELFVHSTERELWEQFTKIKHQTQDIFNNGKFKEGLDIFTELVKFVDQFFVDVMVMDNDLTVRANRLAILYNINRYYTKIADFSRLVFEL